jgi:hypothetical protein
MLFTVNSQELLEVAAIDFVKGIESIHHVLAHPLKDFWRVLVVPRAARIVRTKSFSVFTKI